MVDNFRQLNEYIKQNYQPGIYFAATIVTRRKDGVENCCHWAGPITDSLKLRRMWPMLTAICEVTGGRLYFNPEPRSFKDFELEALTNISDHLRNDTFVSPNRLYMSGLFCSKPFKKLWTLDVDNLEVVPELKKLYPDESTWFQSVSGWNVVCEHVDRKNFPFSIDDVTPIRHGQVLIYYNPQKQEENE